MIDVSKKYVQALVLDSKPEELVELLKSITNIAVAFNEKEFKDAINSSFVDKNKKVELILSFIKEPSKKLENFIKVLADNNRLNLLPQIKKGLQSKISVMANHYIGKIYSNAEISKEKIQELETQFSKKFNAVIKLYPVKSDFNGMKIEIEDLGVEISFSMDRLRSQISEHILKAI